MYARGHATRRSITLGPPSVEVAIEGNQGLRAECGGSCLVYNHGLHSSAFSGFIFRIL